MGSRPTVTRALAADPPHSGLVMDFDGVLSPIVDDPATSAVPDAVTQVLGRLARSLRLVAVMSGRPASFLADRIRIPGVPLIGSYGMEQVWDGDFRIDPGAREWLAAVGDAGQALDDLLAHLPGVRVERKPVSVAVHWRQAADQPAAAEKVGSAVRRVAGQTGLRVEPGKLVEELRPPVDIDKGSAIRALLKKYELSAVAYAGDDLGDEPALRAVHDQAGGYALVVEHGPETPGQLRAMADDTYAGTDDFAGWLAELADAIGA